MKTLMLSLSCLLFFSAVSGLYAEGIQKGSGLRMLEGLPEFASWRKGEAPGIDWYQWKWKLAHGEKTAILSVMPDMPCKGKWQLNTSDKRGTFMGRTGNNILVAEIPVGTLKKSDAFSITVSLQNKEGMEIRKDLNIVFLPLVPWPRELLFSKGDFVLKKDVQICLGSGTGDEDMSAADDLNEEIERLCGFKLKTKRKEARKGIVLERTFKHKNKEAYELVVEPGRIRINGAGPAGLFYGVQTLKQLLVDAEGTPFFWGVKVKDWPAQEIRGLMFDLGRVYHSYEALTHWVNVLSRYKMNIMHLHITDDFLWGLESRKIPKLGSIGNDMDYHRNKLYHFAWKHFPRMKSTERLHLTLKEAKGLNDYAKQHHIEIIPEVELPGHSKYFWRKFPQLRCASKGYEGWYSRQPLCLGKEATYRIVKILINEVIDTFPNSRFFHIGSDEVKKQWYEHWSSGKCPDCKARMKKEGLSNGYQLHGYFVKRVHDMVKNRGKRLIMWSDIVISTDNDLPEMLPKDIIVHLWVNSARDGNKLLNNGFDIIHSPSVPTYLIRYNGGLLMEQKQKDPIGLAYGFDHRDWGLKPSPKIRGTICCMWHSHPNMEYLIWAPLLGFCEKLWAWDTSDLDSLRSRLPYAFYGYRTDSRALREVEDLKTMQGKWDSIQKLRDAVMMIDRMTARIHEEKTFAPEAAHTIRLALLDWGLERVSAKGGISKKSAERVKNWLKEYIPKALSELPDYFLTYGPPK